MRNVLYLMAWLASTAAVAADDRIFDQTVAADPRGTVDISNVSGSIDVIGWDKPQVQVHAEVASSAERVDVSSSKGRISIRIGRNGDSWSGGGHAILTVRVPQGSELEVSAVSATVSSRGVLGAQHLHSVSGNISAQTAADIEVKTVSGNTSLQGVPQPHDYRVGSVSGDVRITGAAGDLEATTVSGALNVALSPAHEVHVHTTSGNFTIAGRLASDGTIEAETISGTMKVDTSGGGYQYDLSTFSGQIENCLGAAVVRPEHGPGERLSGTRGKGGGRVRLRSLSGSLNLCDKS
jgi:DUF4097 and DUF4098 domain-containing protein YvlB